jgi:hypothetical protein
MRNFKNLGKILFAIILFFSCLNKQNNNNSNINSKGNNNLILLSDVNDSVFQFLFDEDQGDLYCKKKGSIDTILKIGKLNNTFNLPPHEIKVEFLDSNRYVFFICTNRIQLGISEDHLHVIGYNSLNLSISELCTFDNLGVYSENLAIDTLEGVRFYDYFLIKDNLKVEVVEYKPYKIVNKLKIQNKYIKEIEFCSFYAF